MELSENETICYVILSVRDDTREAGSRHMRYRENSWLSQPIGPNRNQQDLAGPSMTQQDPALCINIQQDPTRPNRTQQLCLSVNVKHTKYLKLICHVWWFEYMKHLAGVLCRCDQVDTAGQ